MPILTDSEIMIADSARAFAEKAGGIARARRLRQPWPSSDSTAWKEMAALGWIGMLVPETAGGLGLDARSMIVLLEALGESLLPEPIVPAMAAALLLSRCEPSAAADLLARALAGDAICLPVLPEEWPACSDGHAADTFLATSGPKETRLHVVARGCAGFEVTDDETVDGGSRTRIVFTAADPARFPTVAAGETVTNGLGEARDVMRLGYAALLAGLAAAALRLGTNYLKTRQQFGAPIGSFQAIQHRAASLYVDIASSRALLYEASAAFDTPRRSFAAAAAKARWSDVALRVVEECIQFHGAIGFADEHDIGLFLRRAMALAAAGGHPRACRETIGRQSALALAPAPQGQ